MCIIVYSNPIRMLNYVFKYPGFCFITLIFLACQSKTVPEENHPTPNIIFILADDLGYGDVGAYGQELIQTPNIDQLAAEGMKFTQFYSGTSVCAPSRSVLMTGLHNGHTPVRGNKQFGYRQGQLPLPDSVTTVAQYMQNAGYQTGMIGKWGLGEPGTSGDPLKQGWDYFFGYTDQVLAHNYYPEYLWRNGEKVLLSNEVHYLDSTSWHDGLGSYSIKQKEYSHDLFMEDALGYIDQNKERIFFLYLPLTIPHDNGEQVDSLRFEVPTQGMYSDKDWARKEKDYAAMITRMDQGIGQILTLLKELGLEENTLIFFTSDNGPMKNMSTTTFFNSSGPLRGAKRDLYEGGIREPFIVKWPGHIAAGSISNHLGGFWDILATMLDLAGQPAIDNTDGISIVPTLLGIDDQDKHSSLYWEFHEGKGAQAIRQGKWKAVKLNAKNDSNHPMELYDLSTDIGEKNDVAADYPEKVEELEKLMQDSRTPSSHFPLAIDDTN